MSISVRLEDKDRGLQKVMARLRDMHGKRLMRVGLVGEKASAQHQNAGMSVAELGAVHEFGLAEPHIPQRSFVRAYIDKDTPEILALVRRESLLALKGMRTQAQALANVGNFVAKGMQDFIRSGSVKPELALSTTQRKGHSRPLEETGQLVDAITWVRDR